MAVREESLIDDVLRHESIEIFTLAVTKTEWILPRLKCLNNRLKSLPRSIKLNLQITNKLSRLPLNSPQLLLLQLSRILFNLNPKSV